MLSPDGSKIIYCSQRETIYSQIYVMNADGTLPKRLTDAKNGDACGPAWARDGKNIAYYAFAQTNPSRNPEIWVTDSDDSNAKKLLGRGLHPSWSHGGRRIAVPAHRVGVYTCDALNSP